MTPAGASAAEARGLNWIDLSGNAHLRDDQLYVSVLGRPNALVTRGRPSSAFAPRSSRVARLLLLDPSRWWRQTEISEEAHLDTGRVSRIARRLDDGSHVVDELPSVASVQVYLDLLNLPERAAEAAAHMRGDGRLWRGGV